MSPGRADNRRQGGKLGRQEKNPRGKISGQSDAFLKGMERKRNERICVRFQRASAGHSEPVRSGIKPGKTFTNTRPRCGLCIKNGQTGSEGRARERDTKRAARLPFFAPWLVSLHVFYMSFTGGGTGPRSVPQRRIFLRDFWPVARIFPGDLRAPRDPGGVVQR